MVVHENTHLIVRELDNTPESVARSSRLSVRIDDLLTKWLRSRCEQTGETPSELVRLALQRVKGQSERGEQVLGEVRGRAAPEGSTKGLGNGTPGPIAMPATKHDDGGDVRGCETPAMGADQAAPTQLPREYQPLLAQMRTFGVTVWQERRRRFVAAIALSQICWETSHEPRDLEILMDLMSLAQKYGML